jgi:alpha-1,2-mannosyltransferase
MLPSTFGMIFLSFTYTCTTTTTSIIKSVFLTTIAGVWGWPFCLFSGVIYLANYVISSFLHSISFHQIRRDIYIMIISGLAALFFTITGVLFVDHDFYNKWVLTPLNLIWYNMGSHGPDLYGTEPWWFYFANGLILFNIAFLLALMAVPLLVLVLFI